MQYEFRAKTLSGAVRKSLSPKRKQIEKKSSTTIDAGLAGYNHNTISVYVQRGLRYTISWYAEEDAGEGGSYGIDILSHHGHGSYRGAFSRSGRWSFVARTTGEIEFEIGVSRSFGAAWSSYPVDVEID